MNSSQFTPSALILGLDSVVGKALADHLSKAGWQVLGTTRKKERAEENKIWYLDLYKPEDFSFKPKVDVVFLCAAITAVAACEANPEYSTAVNTKAPIFLANYFINKAESIIFLSSDAVFDGSTPFREVDDKVCPNTLYGKQKAEAERALLTLSSKITIVRLTKILAQNSSLLLHWVNALSQNQIIEPFNDVYIAPISVDLVAYFLRIISEQRLTGIIHLSGKEEINYESVAKYFANKMRVSEDLIKAKSALHSNSVLGPLPHRSGLKMQKNLLSRIENQLDLCIMLDSLYEKMIKIS